MHTRTGALMALALILAPPAFGEDSSSSAKEGAEVDSLSFSAAPSRFSLSAIHRPPPSPLFVRPEQERRGFPDWAAISTTLRPEPRESLFGPRRVKLSRFDYALQGAGAGAGGAMLISAMAGYAGLWNEDTAWYAIGAAAGIGALLGGSVGTPDDPDDRFRREWAP